MSLILSASFTRPAALGGPTPLAVGPGWPASNLRIDDGYNLRADVRHRRGYLDDEPDLTGSVLTSDALEHGRRPIPVLAWGASWAALNATLDLLEAIVGQFTYQMTLNIAGTETTWQCDPADVSYTQSKSRAHAKYQQLVLDVPYYPVAVGVA